MVFVCAAFFAVPMVALTVSPAGADTDTFTSTHVGTSGQTPQFTEVGNWTLSWSYNCSAFGTTGNFGVEINQPPGDLYADPGPNEPQMNLAWAGAALITSSTREYSVLAS
jgi:hypothetical protein